MEEGIKDPTKVVRLGFENAVSVTTTLLLTDATMSELPESNKHSTYWSDDSDASFEHNLAPFAGLLRSNVVWLLFGLDVH